MAATVLCAAILSTFPNHGVVIATVTGGVSAAAGILVMPFIADVSGGTVVGAGVAMGLLIGIVEQMSRPPLAAGPGTEKTVSAVTPPESPLGS